MKFAIISDIHLGPENSSTTKATRKLVSVSERLTKEFVNKINDQKDLDFIVNLGDSIQDVKERETNSLNLKKVVNILSKLELPIHYVIGNHDIRGLSEEEVLKIIGIEKSYYSFNHQSFHFVFLGIELQKEVTGYIASVPKKQIEWLKKDLLKTNKPTIVFIHHSLADDSMKGNFWFEEHPQNGLLKNRVEIRKILEDSKKVKAVISAHQHWNKMYIYNEIPYFVVTSLIENFKNDGVPSEAYTIVELNNNEIKIKVKGNDSADFSFRLT